MALQHPYSNTNAYPLQPGNPPPASEPMPRRVVHKGVRYELLVVQQPKRARMCGFGDKDRRPITPPPCVRLVLTDETTGKELDCNDVDHAMFVLNVDLWNEHGAGEVNLVKHSTAPASGTIPVSFGPGGQAPQQFMAGVPIQSASPSLSSPTGPSNVPYNPYPGPPNVNPYSQPIENQAPYHFQPQQGYPSAPDNQQMFNPNGPVSYNQPAGNTVSGFFQSPQRMAPQQSLESSPTQAYSNFMPMAPAIPQTRGSGSQSHPGGMFTRNLIGSLAASAFKLTDPDDRIGIWFILQDLSVRTEGNFRLRFSFVNVGTTSPLPAAQTAHLPASNPSNPSKAPEITQGKAPVLAACFSDVFTVYSAKKFPGVVESTALSRCFATQGIKIPIRKDGPGGKGREGREEYDED